MMPRALFTVCVSTLLLACSTASHHGDSHPAAQRNFEHSIAGGPTPWNHENFDAAPQKFTFAIFSDLTGGEREGVYAVAAEQLRLLRPEFIINVGDLIEGGTEDRAQLAREWDSFEKRSDRARAPVFHVGGNHDLINEVQWEVWEERHGPRFYHFVYADTLFLVLDTEDNTPARQRQINSARSRGLERIAEEGWDIFEDTEYAKMPETRHGTISAAQSRYFQDVIASHPHVRWTFLFMHKPAWMRENEVHFHAIEDALAGRGYTVFNGHNHDYVHRTRRGRDYIQLGTTGGVQLPGKQGAVDHVTLVTVSGSSVDIANLELAGIFDKTGRIPLDGEELCFELAECGAR